MNGILFPVKAIDTKSKTTEIKKNYHKIFFFSKIILNRKLKKKKIFEGNLPL